MCEHSTHPTRIVFSEGQQPVKEYNPRGLPCAMTSTTIYDAGEYAVGFILELPDGRLFKCVQETAGGLLRNVWVATTELPKRLEREKSPMFIAQDRNRENMTRRWVLCHNNPAVIGRLFDFVTTRVTELDVMFVRQQRTHVEIVYDDALPASHLKEMILEFLFAEQIEKEKVGKKGRKKRKKKQKKKGRKK